MSVPVCDHCDGDILTSNPRWPGWCSPECRDAAHHYRPTTKRDRRATKAAERAEARA